MASSDVVSSTLLASSVDAAVPPPAAAAASSAASHAVDATAVVRSSGAVSACAAPAPSQLGAEVAAGRTSSAMTSPAWRISPPSSAATVGASPAGRSPPRGSAAVELPATTPAMPAASSHALSASSAGAPPRPPAASAAASLPAPAAAAAPGDSCASFSAGSSVALQHAPAGYVSASSAAADADTSAAAAAACASSGTGASSAAASPASALAVVVIGMAGSGKSTFVGALQRHLAAAGRRVYTVNLDPAAVALPYDAVNIDIRDTVNYKRVMEHYHLGPNGGILTALNLFATKFGDVLALLEQRKQTHDVILLDTPGQIEAFTWSASGSIILESLAASLPTCVCYILDTPRCCRPVTFMSNMLYACSVLYKARLPFLGVFNKIDVTSHALCQKWMTDYDAFQEALLTDESYLASLSRSSALMLVEFYSIIQTAGASSVTGAGMKGVEQLLDKCRSEYETDFLPLLREKRKANEAKAKARAQTQFAKFKKDYTSSTQPSAGTKGKPAQVETTDSASLKRTDEEA